MTPHPRHAPHPFDHATRRQRREVVVWALVGLVAAVLLAPVFRAVYPLFPDDWSVNREEAAEIALERFRDLGELPADPYVVTRMEREPVLEYRLRLAGLDRGDEAPPGFVPLEDRLLGWEVVVYRPGAQPRDWTYRAQVSPSGEVYLLRRQVPPDQEVDTLDPATVRQRAGEMLARAGFDLGLLGEPEIRRQELGNRTDTAVRYPLDERRLGEEISYGVEVVFAGDQLTGFEPWLDDPDPRRFEGMFQTAGLLEQGRILAPYLLFPLIAFFFLRRYHEGEVGVKRGLQIFFLAFGAAVLFQVLTASSASEGNIFGPLSRRLMTWIWGLQLLILWFSALSLMAALSWSVGEAWCRERWGHKLAAFDAVFQRDLGNGTVARSSLRGLAAGLALSVVVLGTVALLDAAGAHPMATFLMGPWYESAAWPGLALLAFGLVYGLFAELFGRLFLVPPLVRRLGPWAGGALAAVVAAAALFPPAVFLPGGVEVVPSLVAAAMLVALFLRYDLWSALLASLTLTFVMGALPFLLAADPFLTFQGALPLAAVALPLALSVHHLFSEREFFYRYDDVPPHVRRIAERERQRVELETARGIQSSILPELPPQLHGVELASRYLPASEVGGDFYDVMALEDGRLALAVGDVAGHGVSSGLVMSMAKSALAVQVTFDPEVAAVFRTLNRTVYQTARRRLLTTLCYALLDPQRRELVYASAGHLFPYRLDASGRVEPLESIAYPLGVRSDLDVETRTVRLAAGDTLFLMSDGVIEASAYGGDEPFGFERLEESLARWAGEPPQRLCDAVLADVEAFTGNAPRDDDRTVLAVRLPRE